MARKKKHEEHENLERWLVSYADFITLLFAFFVVMYSVSSVNQGKYRVLSDALVASFRSPLKSLEPIQIGEGAKSIYNPALAFVKEPSVFNIPKLAKMHTPRAETAGERTAGAGGPQQGVEGRGIEGRAVEGGTVEGKLRGVISAQGNIDNAYQQPLPPMPATDLPPEELEPGTIISKGSKIGGFGGIDAELPEPLQDTEKTAAQVKLGTLVEGGNKRGGFGGLEVELPESLKEEKAQRDIRAISADFTDKLQGLISGDLVAIRSDEKMLTVEVEIKDNVLFKSGSAGVEPKAVPVLTELSEVLKQFPYPIRVEGFTDNVPISTDVFPSNWELSAIRAASVVKVLNSAGIEPQRLSAVGYGEFRPIAGNDTSAGRQQNRRVILVVEANPAAQPVLQASLPTVPRSITFDKQAVAQPPPVLAAPPPEPAPTPGLPEKPAEAAAPRNDTKAPVAKPPPVVPAPSEPKDTAAVGKPAVPGDVAPEPTPESGDTAVELPAAPASVPAPAAVPEPLPPPVPAPAGAGLQPFKAIDLPSPITLPITPPIKVPAAPERPPGSELTPNALGIKSVWPEASAAKRP